MGRLLTYWRPSLPLNWVTGMRNHRRLKLAFSMVGAASFLVVAISLGEREAAASDAFSAKSATASDASAVHNPTTSNRAWADPTSSSREPQQSTKPIVAGQSPASAEPHMPAEARVEEVPAPPVGAPGSGALPAEGSAAPAVSSPPTRGSAPADVAAYLTLARAKIQPGDIAAARRLLERASDSDAAEAWFALAETYDPQMLARWGVLGVRPDLEKARSLYQRAEARGVQGARERLLNIRK